MQVEVSNIDLAYSLEYDEAVDLVKLFTFYQQSETFDYEMYLFFKKNLEACGHDLSLNLSIEEFNS